MFVCCDCCKLSGRGLWVVLITRTEESYRLLCVIVCDLENIKNEEAIAYVGPQRHRGVGVGGKLSVYTASRNISAKLQVVRQLFYFE